MKKYNNYHISTYWLRSGNISGWTYEIYEGPEDKLIQITKDLPKEMFDSKIRAELASIGYISIMKGVK